MVGRSGPTAASHIDQLAWPRVSVLVVAVTKVTILPVLYFHLECIEVHREREWGNRVTFITFLLEACLPAINNKIRKKAAGPALAFGTVALCLNRTLTTARVLSAAPRVQNERQTANWDGR
jgi:hypothetical protein